MNFFSNSMIFLPQASVARNAEQHKHDVLIALNSAEPYKGIKGK